MLFEVLQVEPVVAPGVDSDLERVRPPPHGKLPDISSGSPRDLRDQTGHLIGSPGGRRTARRTEQQRNGHQEGQ